LGVRPLKKKLDGKERCKSGKRVLLNARNVGDMDAENFGGKKKTAKRLIEKHLVLSGNTTKSDGWIRPGVGGGGLTSR